MCHSLLAGISGPAPSPSLARGSDAVGWVVCNGVCHWFTVLRLGLVVFCRNVTTSCASLSTTQAQSDIRYSRLQGVCVRVCMCVCVRACVCVSVCVCARTRVHKCMSMCKVLPSHHPIRFTVPQVRIKTLPKLDTEEVWPCALQCQ